MVIAVIDVTKNGGAQSTNINNGIAINLLSILMTPIKLNQFWKGRQGRAAMADCVNIMKSQTYFPPSDIPRQDGGQARRKINDCIDL